MNTPDTSCKPREGICIFPQSSCLHDGLSPSFGFSSPVHCMQTSTNIVQWTTILRKCMTINIVMIKVHIPQPSKLQLLRPRSSPESRRNNRRMIALVWRLAFFFDLASLRFPWQTNNCSIRSYPSRPDRLASTSLNLISTDEYTHTDTNV